jgi:hypothetical protein
MPGYQLVKSRDVFECFNDNNRETVHFVSIFRLKLYGHGRTFGFVSCNNNGRNTKFGRFELITNEGLFAA